MKAHKPLHEYTIAGLLYVGAHVDDDDVKTAVMQEIRRRHKAIDAKKEAVEENRIARERVKAALEAEGEVSRDRQARKQRSRSLYDEARDEAFENLSFPDALTPREAVKQFNRMVYDEANRIYREKKRNLKDDELLAHRQGIDAARKAWRTRCVERRRLQQLEQRTYQNARFPVIGLRVTYVDVNNPTPRVGTIRGCSYRKSLCAFIVRLEGEDGARVERALSGLHAADDADAEHFNIVKDAHMVFEEWERRVRDREVLKVRIEEFTKKYEEVDRMVQDYLNSDFRAQWIAADETAKQFAASVRRAATKHHDDPIFD